MPLLRTSGAGAILLIVTLFLAACSRHDRIPTIVVIPHKISGVLWLSEHVGILEASERLGMPVRWTGPNDDELLDEQYEPFDRAIRDQAAGIILSPNVNRAFMRQLITAREHDIPVVLDGEAGEIEPMRGISFVLDDLEVFGRLIAQRLGETLHHHGRIMIAGLNPFVPGILEKSDAIVKALQQYEPGITVSERIFSTTSPAHSEMLIYQALATDNHVRAIVSLTAEESLAAAKATRISGKLNRISIIGCDQSQPVFMLLKLGVLDSLVVEDNRREANLAMKAIVDMRSQLYESRTVYVAPTLMTRENIGTEANQQMLLMHR